MNITGIKQKSIVKKNQMTRGVNQALYKYLPGSWIDFFIKDTRENLEAVV